MRWKFWKKATTATAAEAPAESMAQQPQLAPVAKKSRGRSIGRKKRHFEASCIAGADTGDEEFVFEGFERGVGAPRPALASLKLPPATPAPTPPRLPPHHRQTSELQPAPPPPPRKRDSHSLPRFLRRAASVGRKAPTATPATAVASAAGEKATTSSDEGFPSASSGDLLSAEDDAPLAYCPHCRAVVRPLAVKKRSQIRTNPWVKERKRPRIDVTIQKSLDSGIYDGNNRRAEAAAAEAAAVSAEAAETPEMEEEEEEEEAEVTEIDDEERPVSLAASRPEQGCGDSSSTEASATPVSERRRPQPKRRVRRKRRRRPSQVLQQQHQLHQWQPQWAMPDASSSSDEDFAADAEVLAIHAAAAAAFAPPPQPLSIMGEGVARIGYVPQQQQLMATAEVTPVSMSSGDSSLWWDMDRRHLLLMAPPPDTGSSGSSSSSSSGSLNLSEAAARRTPVLHSETEFDSPPETDSAGSDSELEFEMPGNRMATYAGDEDEVKEESLAETVQRLAAQRDSLERRFRASGEPPRGLDAGCGDGDRFFARELEHYRRELLLRALASVRDQLDCQMSRLERAVCSGPPAVDRRVRLARENFLRQVSAPAYSAAVEALSGERVSYH